MPPDRDRSLAALALDVGRHLMALQRRVATAESCTGGWLAKVLTDPPGSSQWFERGYVTYSNEAKVAELGVLQATLEQHGAVSEEVAREMARGALARSGADVAVAVTGIAGPAGGSGEKPVGTVWFAVQWEMAGSVEAGPPVTRLATLDGDRDAVRAQSVRVALQMLLDAPPISSTAP